MKRQIITQIQATVALLLFVAACNDDATDTWQDAGNGSPLTIQVCSDDFTSPDGSLTRAADMGYTTVFQDGDRLGIVAEQQDGSKQNLCATYNGATKAWEGIYYDSKVKTYISAYFPYQEGLTDQLNNISNAGDVLSALKTLLPPSSDQSSLATYRASDLLTGTCTLNTEAGKSLDVTLTHGYSLLLLRAGTEYTTSDDFAYRLPLRDVQVNVDDALACTPFASAEGYRLIVDKSGSSSVAWFYTLLDGKTYKVAGSASLTAGAYHLYKNVISSTRNLAVGDFYYSDGSIVPNDTETPPTKGCIGIVCWVGSDAFNEDPLLKRDYPGCTHGLVVALKEAGSMHWSDSYEYVQNWVNTENGNPYKDVVNLQATDKRCGYSNTLALKDYNAGKYSSNVNSNNGYRVLPIDAIEQYAVENPAPANSSGWYFPSVMELKYVCWGQGNDQSASGKDNLNPYISKVGGTVFGGDLYWSSTEGGRYSNSNAGGVYFFNGSVVGHRKVDLAYRVRPLLAF